MKSSSISCRQVSTLVAGEDLRPQWLCMCKRCIKRIFRFLYLRVLCLKVTCKVLFTELPETTRRAFCDFCVPCHYSDALLSGEGSSSWVLATLTSVRAPCFIPLVTAKPASYFNITLLVILIKKCYPRLKTLRTRCFLGAMIKESTLKFFISGLATEAQLSCSHILQSCILQGNFEMESGSTVRILVHLGQDKGFY